MNLQRRHLFWPVYVLLLLGVALLGTEAVASFLVYDVVFTEPRFSLATKGETQRREVH